MALKQPTDSVGLRDRKKAATQVALRDTALRLFSERGFANVSVDEIATEANVSRSTFFRYFGSKEAVLFDEVDETVDAFTQLLAARPSEESPWAAFEAAAIAVQENNESDENQQRQRVLDDLLRNDPALSGRRLVEQQRWTEIFAGVFARRRGRPAPEFEDRLAASTCMAVSDEIGRVWRESGLTDPERVFREAFAKLRDF
ncbi:MAG: hypothetical protein QOG04_546 [Actinomycetota bacterium]|jgi:AcrR family transcriptional regulator|nr:hypothetical protein [Actinomycetota bacterium]